ncbi:unnamed protein product [Linum trigynum]|uniref:Secreted protein n=1 Tax=Linum trigynum TaxID=586398 RepID=A0AAV2CDU3_9ROSI
MPDPRSFCRMLVCIASSTTAEGRHLGVSWIERLTRPFWYPNRVPVTRVLDTPPRFGPSENPLKRRIGIRQAGAPIIGKKRNSDWKTRTTLGLDFLFLLASWRRETAATAGGEVAVGSEFGNWRRRCWCAAAFGHPLINGLR